MYVTYYRVSTQRQGQSGLGLEAQRSAVQAYLAGKEIIAEFTEVESGRKTDRPQLAAALALAKKQKATLVIAKLDRLARNVHFISGLLESNVQFVAADMPEADRTFLQMAAVFAEWEAKKISERTKSALAAAKARGTVLGSPAPQIGSQAGLKAISDRCEAYCKKVAPSLQDIVSKVGTNLRTVAAELEIRGIKTATGLDVWHPAQVGKLLRRVQYA
jgi:DNA invertase Pin-like site-specific DNA recombinase